MELSQEVLKKEEVLRYLGYRGSVLPKETEELVEQCIEETIKTARPLYRYQRFPLERTAEGIIVTGAKLCLTGKDISRHLAGCKEAYLLCATVGSMIDRNIRLKMIQEPAAGVILDSCGSVAVEAVIEAAEQEVSQTVQVEGKQITWRFSPGYGDLPLALQREFAEALDVFRKMGVGVSESLLLTPSKSVTAIIGVIEPVAGENEKNHQPAGIHPCSVCLHREQCSLFLHGKSCKTKRL